MLNKFSSRDEFPLIYNFQICVKVFHGARMQATFQSAVKTASLFNLSWFSLKDVRWRLPNFPFWFLFGWNDFSAFNHLS